MGSSAVDITIFIRARNEAHLLPQCLEALVSQRVDASFEILMLDSESTDDTVAIAKGYPISIMSAPSRLFSYSAALNLGVRRARGNLFVALSAHAVPCNEVWLSELIRPLRESRDIGASFSRQITWPDACLREVRAQSASFPQLSYVKARADIEAAISSGVEPFDAVVFSNASSCIRRELALQMPFRKVPFAEDRFFAMELIKAGFAVAYSASSLVYHSHAPHGAEFFRVAERATRSRFMINRAAKRWLPKARFRGELTELLSATLRLPIVIIFVILKRLISAFSANNRREVEYLAASVGTSAGKLRGAQAALIGSRAEPPGVADATALEGALTIIQEHSISRR